MTSESFISQYEQFGREWLSKDGPKLQGKDIDKATEALTATVEKRAKGHIDDVGIELLRILSVDKPIVATAGASLIRFGKIHVGALINHSFINKVLLEFALHDQEIIDKFNEDLKKVCKLDKVAQKVSIAALKSTAEETFRKGLNCSGEPYVHFLANIGRMNRGGSAGYRVYSACLRTIIKIMTMAMTRENTRCVLLGSVMLYKSDMQGPNKMTKDDITKMISFDYQKRFGMIKCGGFRDGQDRLGSYWVFA